VLHVLGSVGELHETKGVPLVEPTGAQVLLEHPQAEAGGPAPLGEVEKPCSDTAPLMIGVDVDVFEHLVRERGETDDASLDLGDPQLVPLDEPAAELWPILIPDAWQVGHEVTGLAEDETDSVRVLHARAPQHAPILPRVRKRDEPVRLTRIYTRGGDAGETSLGDGSRVSKLDPRIVAYGTADELNASVGHVLAGDCPDDVRGVLVRVQNELFDLGADVAVPLQHEGRLRITDGQVDALERDCDRFNDGLPELKSFILPGGSETAARLHVARTICRRAEREALLAAETYELNSAVLVYLNRLSDLLFILARAVTFAEGREEPLWTPGSSR
jgi:cob(I)alamin adenosyltransferase